MTYRRLHSSSPSKNDRLYGLWPPKGKSSGMLPGWADRRNLGRGRRRNPWRLRIPELFALEPRTADQCLVVVREGCAGGVLAKLLLANRLEPASLACRDGSTAPRVSLDDYVSRTG